MLGSSSLPSLQSGSPSHFHESKIHRPFERHLNSMLGQGSVQLVSSELSPQSSIPSQIVADGVQLRFSHWNAPPRQYLVGHWLCISSDPSAQSLSPSHLKKKKTWIKIFITAIVQKMIFLLPKPRYTLLIVFFTFVLSCGTVGYASLIVTWVQIKLIGTSTSK